MRLNTTFTDNDGDTAQFRVGGLSDGLVIELHQKASFRGDQCAITVFDREKALAIRDALIEAFPLATVEALPLVAVNAQETLVVGEIEAFPVPQGITINIQSLTINA